jgi:hypothetical protein
MPYGCIWQLSATVTWRLGQCCVLCVVRLCMLNMAAASNVLWVSPAWYHVQQ